MNIQNFFVKSLDQSALVDCISDRLNAPPDPPGLQPDWGLHSSYDIWLAEDAKRKIAISPVTSGWIVGVESKQVVDFKLLQTIAENLRAEVIACQVHMPLNYFGYARCVAGKIAESQCREGEDDPLRKVHSYLCRLGAPSELFTFPEAIRLRSAGWRVLKRG